ncbi:hypothetical protein ECEC1864_1937, partial [Escherichia coli EC1864]
KSGTGGDA